MQGRHSIRRHEGALKMAHAHAKGTEEGEGEGGAADVPGRWSAHK